VPRAGPGEPIPATPRLSVTRFLAFGDSLTEGFIPRPDRFDVTGLAATMAPPTSYPFKLHQRLRQHFPRLSFEVDLSAVGGETIFGGFTRLPQALDAFNPEVLLLFEGVNGITLIGPTVVAEFLRAMVVRAQARGVFVLLATLTPVGPDREALRPGVTAAIVDLNARIRAMSLELGLGPAVDLHSAFAADPTLLSSDHFHPNQRGYTRIADEFFRAIRARFEVRERPRPGDQP
jgi:lysophospholipase L1-like esterase